MVVCDAVLRKLPGRLGTRDSALEESFSDALGGDPEYPHYTRPSRVSRLARAGDPPVRASRADRAFPGAHRRASGGEKASGSARPSEAHAMRSVRYHWRSRRREPSDCSSHRAFFFAMSSVIETIERAHCAASPTSPAWAIVSRCTSR